MNVSGSDIDAGRLGLDSFAPCREQWACLVCQQSVQHPEINLNIFVSATGSCTPCCCCKPIFKSPGVYITPDKEFENFRIWQVSTSSPILSYAIFFSLLFFPSSVSYSLSLSLAFFSSVRFSPPSASHLLPPSVLFLHLSLSLVNFAVQTYSNTHMSSLAKSLFSRLL